VTANEPPNPYAAPGTVVADGGAVAPTARQPSRLLATATTFLAYPFVGAGLVILGARRRLVAWVTTGVLLQATLIVAVRLPLPRLSVAALAGITLAAILAVVHTALTRPQAGHRGGRAWLIAIALVLGAKGAGLFVKYALVESFRLPSGSMVPTLLVGDQVFVKKGAGDVARGDVIVFRYPADPSTDYIKRVVAIGGDAIEVKHGVPWINGTPLAQTAIGAPCSFRDESAPGEAAQDCTLARETNAGRAYTVMLTSTYHAQDFDRIVVPAGEVFVLGDNRDNSMDSRKWGPLPEGLIKGKATVIWWSMEPTCTARWSRVGHGVE